MAKIHFPSYKGINLTYFPRAGGGSGYATNTAGQSWLEDWWDADVADDVLDHILTGGIKTIRAWAFAEGWMTKTDSPTFGNAGWIPAWNATALANFQTLCTKLQARGMKMIVSLFLAGSSGGARNQWDESCLVPTPTADPALMDGTTNHGNLDQNMNYATPNAAANWRFVIGTFNDEVNCIYQNDSATAGSQQTDLDAGYSTKEYKIIAGGAISVRTPIIAFPTSDLCYMKILLRGDINSLDIQYYRTNNTAVESVNVVGTTTYADWTEVEFPSKSDNLDADSTKFAIVVSFVNGQTGYIGTGRINYGTDSAMYTNYLDALENFFVTLHGSGTDYESAIAGCNIMKEAYASINYWKMHRFLKDAYDRIKQATGIPVMIDSTTSYVPITTAANQVYYTDAADVASLHVYNDTGTLAEITAPLPMPWILGEGAATGNPPVAATNAIALQNLLDASYNGGALCALAWQWVTSLVDPQLPDKVSTGVHPYFDWTVPGQVLADWTPETRFRNARAMRSLKNEVA